MCCSLFSTSMSAERDLRAAISNAILVCFLIKLLREGGYFPPEQWFFIFIYILNHRQYRHEIRSIARQHLTRMSMGYLCPYPDT